uniref:Uncharacterized protein n=1 Tax=Cacopsylla melanoneura TaxID=428564 RepID=A0A8D9C351_9HEMI
MFIKIRQIETAYLKFKKLNFFNFISLILQIKTELRRVLSTGRGPKTLAAFPRCTAIPTCWKINSFDLFKNVSVLHASIIRKVTCGAFKESFPPPLVVKGPRHFNNLKKGAAKKKVLGEKKVCP